MTQQVPFNIKSGLPYSRTFVVDLPTGRDWWTLGTEFEVLSQIREGTSTSSDLILDLSEFIDMTVTLPDTITLDLILSGSDTRQIHSSGHYDILLSDKFATDDRVIMVSFGSVFRTSVVTASQAETNV